MAGGPGAASSSITHGTSERAAARYQELKADGDAEKVSLLRVPSLLFAAHEPLSLTQCSSILVKASYDCGSYSCSLGMDTLITEAVPKQVLLRCQRTLDGLGGIQRIRVEGNPRARGMSVRHVDEALEPRVGADGSDGI